MAERDRRGVILLKESTVRLYPGDQAPVVRNLQAGEQVSLGETRPYQGGQWTEIYSGKQKIGYCIEPETNFIEAEPSTGEGNGMGEFLVKMITFIIAFAIRGDLLTRYQYTDLHWTVPLLGQFPWNLMEIAIFWVGLCGMFLILLARVREISIYAWILILVGLYIWMTPGIRNAVIFEDQKILVRHWPAKTEYHYSDVDKVELKYELVRFSKHNSYDWVQYIRFKNGEKLKILDRNEYYRYLMHRVDKNFYLPPPVRIRG